MAKRDSALASRFGDNLLEYRRLRQISQAELASLADLDRTEVGLLERGKREPRLVTLIRLAATLDVSLDLLCEGIGWQVVAYSKDAGALLIHGRLTE